MERVLNVVAVRLISCLFLIVFGALSYKIFIPVQEPRHLADSIVMSNPYTDVSYLNLTGLIVFAVISTIVILSFTIYNLLKSKVRERINTVRKEEIENE